MSAPETAPRGGRAWLRRGLRLGMWLVGTLAALVLFLVGALLFLARGGPEPYVWSPPPTPPVEATGPRTFAVSVTPASAPADVPVQMEVNGMRPGSSVLVVATAEDARGIGFESWARFVADGDGRLDLGVAARLALRRPVAFLPSYSAALAASDERSAIPVEQIAGEVLVAAGGDDRVWPSAEMAERICRRMGPARCTPRIYPEAGHGLRPSCGRAGTSPSAP